MVLCPTPELCLNRNALNFKVLKRILRKCIERCQCTILPVFIWTVNMQLTFPVTGQLRHANRKWSKQEVSCSDVKDINFGGGFVQSFVTFQSYSSFRWVKSNALSAMKRVLHSESLGECEYVLKVELNLTSTGKNAVVRKIKWLNDGVCIPVAGLRWNRLDINTLLLIVVW